MLSCQNMKSLQEICLSHIQWTLEEYPVDVLALLPKAFREEMLHNLPIVDICRLEDTQFTSGMNMDSTVWKKLYKSHIITMPLPPPSYRNSWKQRYFWRVSTLILNGPYGKSKKYHVNSHHCAENAVADIVHYLVAVKHSRPRNSFLLSSCTS